MDRDKVFLELTKGLMSNPNIVKGLHSLNYSVARTQLIDMAKMMTNLVMREITDEEEED